MCFIERLPKISVSPLFSALGEFSRRVFASIKASSPFTQWIASNRRLFLFFWRNHHGIKPSVLLTKSLGYALLKVGRMDEASLVIGI